MNTNATITVITDSQPLSFVSNCKRYYSRYFELAVALSQFRSLEVLYLPGRFLALADEISRNIQDVIVAEPTNISEQFAQICPPIPSPMKEKIMKMTNSEFRTFLMSDQDPSLFDIHDRNMKYSQRFDSKDISKLLREASLETSLFAFLRAPFDNPDLYKLNIFKELASVQKKMTKTSFMEILKIWKLNGLFNQLEKLKIPNTFYKELKANFEESDRQESLQRLQALRLNKDCAQSVSHILLAHSSTDVLHSAAMRTNMVNTRSQTRRRVSRAGDGDRDGNNPFHHHQERQTPYHQHPSAPLPPLSSQDPTICSDNKEHYTDVECSPTFNQKKTNCKHAVKMLKNEDIVGLINYLQNFNLFEHFLSLAKQFCYCFHIEDDVDNNEIKHLISKIENSDCIFEKTNFLRHLITKICTLASSTSLCLGRGEGRSDGNNSNTEDSNITIKPFIYYFHSSSVTGQLKNKYFEFISKQNISIDPFQSKVIEVKFFCSLETDITLEINLPSTFHCELDIITDLTGCGFYVRRLLIFNLINETQQINSEQSILYIIFSNNPYQQYLPMFINPEFISNKLRALNSFASTLGQEKIETIMSKYLVSQKSHIVNSQYVGIHDMESELIVSAIRDMGSGPGCPVLKRSCDLTAPAPPHSSDQSIPVHYLESSVIRRLTAPFDCHPGPKHQTFSTLTEQSRQALNSLLVNRSLCKSMGTLNYVDLYELQRNDDSIRGIIKKLGSSGKQNGSSGNLDNFQLIDDLLYHVSTPPGSEIKSHRLCLPPSLCLALLTTLHSSQLYHLSSTSLRICYASLFYTKDVAELCKRVTKSCGPCILGTNRAKRVVKGEHRSLDNNLSPGSHLNIDTMMLPPTKDKIVGVTIYCCQLTGYTSVFPIRSVNARELARTLTTYLSVMPSPYYIASDRGSEISAPYFDICKRFNIAIISPVQSYSNAQATAESNISLFKNLLNKAVHSFEFESREKWPMFLPHIVQTFNSSRLYASQYCRISLRFSPMQKINSGFGAAILANPSDSAEIHKKQLLRLRDLRRQSMENDYYYNRAVPFEKGAICIRTISRQEQSTTNQSKQLLSGVKDVVRILDRDGNVYKVKSMLTQSIGYEHRRHLERITIEDLYEIKLSSSDLFRHVATARVNRNYKRLNYGLELSTKHYPHPSRRLPSVLDDNHRDAGEEDTNQDPEDHDHPEDCDSVTCHTVSTSHSILKILYPPPLSAYPMTDSEFRALAKGFSLSLRERKHTDSMDDPVLQNTFLETLKGCKSIITPTLSRSSSISEANSQWKKFKTKARPSKVTFDTSGKDPIRTTSIETHLLNPYVLTAALTCCCSLVEMSRWNGFCD